MGSRTLQSLLLLSLLVTALSATGRPKSSPPPPPSFGNIGIKSSTSAIFPLGGDVYPRGMYFASLLIGNPPKPYYLDVDTGSDLTWVQCDAPCVSCAKGPHPYYRPAKNKLVPCETEICVALHESTGEPHECHSPTQCDYEIQYADHWSSIGVLIADSFALRLANSSLVRPTLAFGCGYDQQGNGANGPSEVDGVLGLGKGKPSILSQLKAQGVTKNVIGHCLSMRGGGYLYFGDDLVPSTGMNWAPMSPTALRKYYSPGQASLYFGKQSLAVKELPVVLDSGSSYTYFTNQPYQAFLSAECLLRTSSVSEYDLGGEGDLFKAPEPIIEEPVLALDPISAAMTIISNGDDVISGTIEAADMESIQNEHLNDVFYECKKDLLEKCVIDETFSEFCDVKIPVLPTETVPSSDKIRFGTEGQMLKSVSSGCLNSMDWISSCAMRPNFLDFQGMDFETVFGLRRAYSEGDIQALGFTNANAGNTSSVRACFERQLTISEVKTEERQQKLSRYRKKKSKRNFGRKIKYACRKALADSQPRVRGRFAKTEECEVSKTHE